MAIDAAKAFEADNGFRPNENGTQGPFYTGGPASPVGLDLPVDTFYVQNQGTGGVVLWRKYGTGVNDWTKAQPKDFYQTTSDTVETSTTSTTTFLTKLTLTTPSLPSGDYRLDFMYKWRNANANRSQDIRIQRNSANALTGVNFNPALAENSLNSGFLIFSAISGVQTITLQFKVSTTATTTFMSEARFAFERVA